MARHTFLYLTHFLFLSTSALPKTIKPPMATQPEEDVFYNLFASIGAQESADEYYAFLEPSFKYPPKVRPPPYREENRGCSVSFDDIDGNLCGDLNKEGIPQNPMGQRPHRQSYPFELIRNHTLRFLPRTQPELSTNDTLPQVTYYYPKTYNAKPLTISGEVLPAHPLLEGETTEQDADSLPLYLVPPGRQRRAAGSYGWSLCGDGGLLCTVESYVKAYADYYDVKGWLRELGLAPEAAPEPPHTTTTQPLSDALSTCPARVKYVTPLFARNYQGAWRYVVQLPHEELFTQSVEVTRCLESQCQYMDGECKSFPRWVSLLVAEIDYPPQDQNLQKEHTPLVLLQAEYQQFRQNGTAQPAAAQPSADQHTHCDGHDENGCYQVKVYYDKFLVPGSCRCWRRGFLEEYRRNYQTEL